MYVKLMKRREIGRYGDGVSGGYRLARVQRVDQHEIGAGLAVRLDQQVLRSSKSPTPQDPAERMEYSWAIQPHSWSCSMAEQHRNTLGGADQRGVLRAVAHADMQRMVSHRQIRGYGDGCASPTNLPSTSYACDPSPAPGSSAPWYSSPFSSVMVAEGICMIPVLSSTRSFLADDMQHGRGDETPVALAKDTDNGIIDGVIVMGVHAQHTQQRLQDIIIDLVIVVAHADVARGQSNQTRQMDQRTRETLRTFCTLCHIP